MVWLDSDKMESRAASLYTGEKTPTRFYKIKKNRGSLSSKNDFYPLLNSAQYIFFQNRHQAKKSPARAESAGGAELAEGIAT